MKRINLNETKGLEIADYAFDDDGQKLVITFKSGVYTSIVVDDYGDYMNSMKEEDIEKWNFGDNQMIRLGLITKSEIDERIQRIAELKKTIKN